jgi:hypothetical protein
MRYPPALIFAPKRSRMYGAAAILIAILLIALCAYSMPASGHFELKNAVVMLLAAVASLWLLRDALQRPRGQLAYAQGQWVWQSADGETAGTCALHLDLQVYMLVSFAPSAQTQSATTGFFPIKTQWFHLEARHVDHGAALASLAGQPCWQALRRAVYAQAQSSHEELAA